MKTRCIYFFTGAIISALTFLSCSTPRESQPNIVFIFADDQCFSTINALEDSSIYTPHLDQLVKNGISFSNTFNMGGWNGAICIASRTMLLTGKYIWDAYKADSLMNMNRYDTPVWSELLSMAGYDTYMSGKWHIKKPAEQVFDYVKNVRPGMPNQTNEGYDRPKSPTDTLWRPWDVSHEGFWKGGRHWSEVLGDDAVNFLDTASQKDNPFFMYLAFNAPHDPRQSPKEFVDMYPLEDIELPANFLPEYPYNEEMGSGRMLRDERLAPFPRTDYAVRVNRQEYYAIITHMDRQIGRILDAIKTSGEMDNTYIIFGADHGLSVGQHGLLGKQNMYDHSVRVPMLISGPDIPKAKKIDTDVYLQDIMPTVLEIAGIEKPDYVDFRSVLPMINGQSPERSLPIYGCYTMTQRMIRSGGFKLIAYPAAKKLRLFDLNKDPLEINDLSDHADFQEVKSQLLNDLLKLQEEMKDPLTLDPGTFL